MGMMEKEVIEAALAHLGETEEPMGTAVLEAEVVVVAHDGKKYRVPLSELGISEEAVERAAEPGREPEDIGIWLELNRVIGAEPTRALLNAFGTIEAIREELAFGDLTAVSGIGPATVGKIRGVLIEEPAD